MQKHETREIDGLRFTVQQLPARRGMKLLNHLIRIAGPGLAKAAGALKGGDLAKLDLANIDFGALGEALKSIFDGLPDVEFDYVLDEMLAVTLLNEAPLKPVFDAALQGRIGTVYKLLAFALEVNFRDFFGGLSGLTAGPLAKLLKSSSEGSNTSKQSGPSGDLS